MILFNRQYSIGDLMNIDMNRQNKAAMCSVELLNTYHEVKKVTLLDRFKSIFNNGMIQNYTVIFKFLVTSDTGSKHIVFLRTSPDFDLVNWNRNKVQIYCDCSDFKYRSAYRLNQHRSLFVTERIKVALGSSFIDSPKSKTKTTLLCKHSFAVINWVISNYSSIMSSL